ncbi:TylF/MycF/NovP-related O-methyltransferase [Robertmurraya massiliosenegalensis]|uniref:TylF/MycF/NovP-related O-methyltransferase n=1 Tax=Robertmurraya TaxID=2837507 RepID=UPI0039A4A49A
MYEKVRALIFGTGDGATKALNIIDSIKVDIIGFIDNDEIKQGNIIYGKMIYKPSYIYNLEYDYIIIASMFYKEIMEQLIELGVSRNKIVKILKPHRNEKTSKHLVREITLENNLYKKIIKKEYLGIYFKNFAVSDMYVFDIDRNLKLYDYPDRCVGGLDFVRASTLELLSREIIENNIPGAVAELGVYKGDFSLLISDLFPDRKLYLFDTFEGFDVKDILLERELDFSNASVGGFGDTSFEFVKNKIQREENLVIRKGYFPDTTSGLDNEKYSFVSIDVDLYKPTLDGLNYFYERLSKGGYILIHDYNYSKYSGVKKAVKAFCDLKGVNIVPISDYFGSAIIIK